MYTIQCIVYFSFIYFNLVTFNTIVMDSCRTIIPFVNKMAFTLWSMKVIFQVTTLKNSNYCFKHNQITIYKYLSRVVRIQVNNVSTICLFYTTRELKYFHCNSQGQVSLVLYCKNGIFGINLYKCLNYLQKKKKLKDVRNILHPHHETFSFTSLVIVQQKLTTISKNILMTNHQFLVKRIDLHYSNIKYRSQRSVIGTFLYNLYCDNQINVVHFSYSFDIKKRLFVKRVI